MLWPKCLFTGCCCCTTSGICCFCGKDIQPVHGPYADSTIHIQYVEDNELTKG